MSQDIKNKELQERQAYVPVSVKVIKVTLHGILCQSGGIYNMQRDGDGGELFN